VEEVKAFDISST